MHRLVDNLLELTRLSSGPVRLKREWVSMEELVGAVLHRHRETLAGSAIELDVSDDLPMVYCDEVMIWQVLSNLVENAHKHAPGAAIRVSAQVRRGEMWVTVADKGPGLPPGDAQHLFDKFHRGREEGAQSGFGLGLAICKAIVEAHDGRIEARNVPEGGAEFSFSLPLVQPPEMPS